MDRLDLGSHLHWSVAWGHEIITKDVRKSLTAALKSEMFTEYLRKDRQWPEEVIDEFPKSRWPSRLAYLADAATATVLNKLITGWLATLTIQARRANPRDGPVPTLCRLCGLTVESNWHVLAECTHSVMVNVRRTLTEKILKVIERLPLPPALTHLLSVNWLVADDGALKKLNTADDLDLILSDWAPIAGEAVTNLHVWESLLWGASVGKNSDDLRK